VFGLFNDIKYYNIYIPDSTNIYRSILIGLGVLVIAVFGVGFVVGYCVRDKCQR